MTSSKCVLFLVVIYAVFRLYIYAVFRVYIYGHNTIVVEVKSYIKLFFEEVLFIVHSM